MTKAPDVRPRINDIVDRLIDEITTHCTSKQQKVPPSELRMSSKSVSLPQPSQRHSIGLGSPRLIPGRESHTADLDAFDRYLYRLLTDERPHHRSDSPPYDEDFWNFVRTVLESAKPVGFNELPDPNAVSAKGPKQCYAFFDKIRSLGDVTPMHPAHLAKSSGISPDAVLEELLYATRVGLVSMMWAPECSRCGCAVVLESNIAALPSEARCEVCDYPNTIDALDHVMVTFILSQDVLYLPSSHPFGCRVSQKIAASAALLAPVPATSTGSGFRFSVGCDGNNMLRPSLEPGKYRLLCPYSLTDFTIEVKEETEENTSDPFELEIWASDTIFNARNQRAAVTLPHGRIRFDVLPDTQSFFFLTLLPLADAEELFTLPKEERITFTTATQVMHHQVFQELFSDQVVGDRIDVGLSILQTVVVVMDLVGTTELCTSLGDGPALKVVRELFEVVSRAFTSHGRVVKRVGDTITGSFTTGGAAIEATAEAMKDIWSTELPPDVKPVEIRAAIHCGSTLVVPLNGVNDYFGQTVSIANDIKATSKANECLVTEAVLSLEPDALAAFRNLEKIGMHVGTHFEARRDYSLRLQGVPEPIQVFGFRIKYEEAGGETKGRRIPILQSLQNEVYAGLSNPIKDAGNDSGAITFLQKSQAEKDRKQAEHVGNVDNGRVMSFMRKNLHVIGKSLKITPGVPADRGLDKNPAA